MSILQKPKMICLPITFTTLRVAVLNVPSQLTQADYDHLLSAVRSFEEALTKPSGQLELRTGEVRT